MFSETLVFLLIVAGLISLQNTFTGVSYYSLPVILTAVSVTVAASWALGVVGLVLAASMTTDFGDGVSSVLLRGGRAACGVVVLHVTGVAILCVVHPDPDIYVAFVTGNHLFSPDSSLMYHIFAVAFGLGVGSALVCVLIAQNGTLTVIDRRGVLKGSALTSMPRTAWNFNAVLICLFEVQVVMDHNISSAFAVRQVLGSWQTLAGLPTLLLFDLLSVKMVHINRLWSVLVVVTFHVLVVSAWVVTAFFSTTLHTTNAMYVNAAFAAIQIMCIIGDVVRIFSGMRSQGKQTSASGVSKTQTAHDVDNGLGSFDMPVRSDRRGLFDMPVRSGSRSIFQKKTKNTPTACPTSDIRVKKCV